MLEELKEALRNNIVEVRFEKKDGVVRDMLCTLHPNALPDEYLDDSLDKVDLKPKNENVQPVYDLEKRAWRSFRLDSVLTWKIK